MDVFIAIALLCMINHGHQFDSIEVVKETQLACQKYYVKCTKSHMDFGDCIIKKDK
jgi:hypothetical protein